MAAKPRHRRKGKPGAANSQRNAKRKEPKPALDKVKMQDRRHPSPSSHATSSQRHDVEGPARHGRWLYGRHAVAAALANPTRRFRQMLATRQGADWLIEQGLKDQMIAARVEEITRQDLDTLLPPGSVHQGLALDAEPLPAPSLEDLCEQKHEKSLVVVLDQITDPQNIGSIFRSAAAFGADAVIVQDRRTPPLTGALAKAAVGTIETLPCIRVVNIARALSQLQDAGFFCIGLTGKADRTITEMAPHNRAALVAGAEGAGLRPLVAKNCDQLVRISMAGAVESLNVSTATAITLHALMHQ